MENSILFLLFVDENVPTATRRAFVQSTTTQLIFGRPFETDVKDDMVAITILPTDFDPHEPVTVNVSEMSMETWKRLSQGDE